MCDTVPMATANRSNATTRLVVVLKQSEKKRVQSFARKERVSSSELLRRSFQDYVARASAVSEEDELRAAIGEMDSALDMAIVAVRSARIEVAENIAKMRKMRGE